MSAPAALLALALAAGAAPDLALTAQRPVARNIDAYPRISVPATAETAKINDALTKSDARVKNAARDCSQNDPDSGQWRRAVAVPFRYGDFLTLTAADDWRCTTFSGAFQATMTYDLKTGAPVDWRTLFLPRVAGDPAETAGGDTTRLSVVVSPILNEVYRRKALLAMDAGDRDGCTDGFQSNYLLMLWLDAEHEGVAMRGVGFPRTSAACAQEVLLTSAELTLLRAEPRLVEALKAAHAAHAWSAEIRPAGSRPRPAAPQ